MRKDFLGTPQLFCYRPENHATVVGVNRLFFLHTLDKLTEGDAILMLRKTFVGSRLSPTMQLPGYPREVYRFVLVCGCDHNHPGVRRQVLQLFFLLRGGVCWCAPTAPLARIQDAFVYVLYLSQSDAKPLCMKPPAPMRDAAAKQSCMRSVCMSTQ